VDGDADREANHEAPGETHDGAAPRPDTDAAFARYVVPEIPVMLRVARSLTSQQADAEDLVQDSLVRAYRAIDRFDGAHPRAWLLTIVRNTHRNRLRTRLPVLLDDGEDAAASLERRGRPAASAEDVVVDGEFEAAVSAALDALPRPFQDVVRLVDLEGLSYQQAADRLGVPRGTVMSRLHRARGRIRDALGAAGVAPSAGIGG
jgi:RNA polymerase sigma-70 factor (ECF subfamily)